MQTLSIMFIFHAINDSVGIVRDIYSVKNIHHLEGEYGFQGTHDIVYIYAGPKISSL